MLEFSDGKYLCDGENVDPYEHLPTIGNTPFPSEAEATIREIVDTTRNGSITQIPELDGVQWVDKRDRLHVSLGRTSRDNNLLLEGEQILLKIDLDLLECRSPAKNLTEIDLSGDSVLFNEILAHAPNGSWVAQLQPVPVYIRDPHRSRQEYVIDSQREQWIDPFRIQFLQSKWVGLEWKNGNIGVDNTGTARLTNYGTITESY